MSDVDPRPRPEYGEYASEEEQRARIAQPDTTWALDTGHAANDAPAPAPRTAHPVDRVVTIGLLVWGVLNVTMSVISFLDLPTAAAQAMQIMGIEGTFTNVAGARLWGGIAAGVLALGYLVTAVLAVRRVRRGRIAWWIPVTGAAVTYLVVWVLIAIPLLGDPAFLASLSGG